MILLKERFWIVTYRDNRKEGGLTNVEEIGPQRGTRRRKEMA